MANWVRRTLVVVLAAAAATAALAGGTAGAASGASCTLDVSAPFFYADIVFAPATISCAASQNKITVTTVLTRDGVEVARNTRHCRHTDVCHNEVGSWANDVAGDQTWCTTAWGTVQGMQYAAQTRCESEAF